MKKRIVLYLLILGIIILLPIIIKAENNDDLISISLDCGDEIDIGTEIEASCVFDSSIEIIRSQWYMRTNHDISTYGYSADIDSTGKTSFIPNHNGKCYMEIIAKKTNGDYIRKKSKEVIVHGINVDIKAINGIKVVDILTDYYGNMYICSEDITLDYSVTGGSGEYTITTYWFGVDYSSVIGEYETEHIISHSPSGTMHLKPTKKMETINYHIYVEDSNNNTELYSYKIQDGYLTHCLVYHGGEAPTWETTGTEGYWECEICGKMFSDSEETTEIEAPIVIPMCEPESDWNGWVQGKSNWYFFLDGTPITSDWICDGIWYYFDATGRMVTGWQQIGGTWYYFTASGTMATGWISDGGTWYYFNTAGAMVTGWISDGSTWYYLEPSGAMATGWQPDGGAWYYFEPSGAMVTGWQSIDGVWYSFSDSGAMRTGWYEDKASNWYYFDASGAMTTGWKAINGTRYYFRNSGIMATGWFEDKIPNSPSVWYWFDKNGVMATGWKEINGQWEMFDDNGAWLYTWDGN